ncbi:MAG TPA: hypothetical protein VJU87_08410, partial [Gemmatimonadaceae bacterium]|nr:hypothetical protein [Gemmatimonadaceae bacterium]
NEYMLKAEREAKRRTSWTEPDAAYEDALAAFVDAVLERGEESPFLTDVARFVAQIAPRGHWNALARLLLQLTAPGTPDIYRGDELWFFALVDPDNRRPVDYALRRRALDEVLRGSFSLAAHDPPVMDPADPRLKLLVLHRLLEARRGAAGEGEGVEEGEGTAAGHRSGAGARAEHDGGAVAARRAVFTDGAYVPLEVHGAAAAHLVAFARAHEGRFAVSLAPRLLGSLRAPGEEAGAWKDTFVVLPPEIRAEHWRSVVDRRQIRTAAVADGGARGVWAPEAFATLPLALLLSP